MCEVHRYEDAYGLAALPWFERRDDGRIAVVDPDVPTAIDMHTHLALAFVRPMAVDLWRGHPRTEVYLPLERRLDLDVYVNRNFTPGDLERLTRDLSWRSLTAGGMRGTHTATNLLRDMDDTRVARSVLLAIDFPAPLSQNAETYLEVARRDPRLLTFGSVHPFVPDLRARLARQVALGARGVKMHPAIQLVAPDHPRAMRLYDACADLGLPVLWHCGPVDIETRLGRRLSQLKHYWRAVHDCPRTTFVLGHSGALQMPMALELAKAYPNVWLELSSQGLPNVRRILDEAPEDRVVFGSDWPFYHQAIPLAKVLLATSGRPERRRRVLWENAARLLGIAA